MVDVTGLRRPWTRKFGGKTYTVESRASTIQSARKIAESYRKNRKKARIVKVRKGQKYAIYTRSK
jgi:hypothetical protein